jgi:hypothetical protein
MKISARKACIGVLKRICSVCGNDISIRVINRHIHGGHYFGKIKIPIKETGKYIKVGTSEILDGVDVVKWTGKEKEFEHWECDKCYGD